MLPHNHNVKHAMVSDPEEADTLLTVEVNTGTPLFLEF